MISEDELKEMLEIALDEEIDDFDLETDFYEEYAMDSMGAVAFFVEIQKRTGVVVNVDQVKPLRSGKAVLEFLRVKS